MEEKKCYQDANQSRSADSVLNQFLCEIRFASRGDRDRLQFLISRAFDGESYLELSSFVDQLKRLSDLERYSVFNAIAELAQENLCAPFLYQSLARCPGEAEMMALCFRYMSRRNELTRGSIEQLLQHRGQIPLILRGFVEEHESASSRPIR